MTRTFEFDIWEEDAPVILVADFPDFETWEEGDTAVIVVGGAGAVVVLRRRVCEF